MSPGSSPQGFVCFISRVWVLELSCGIWSLNSGIMGTPFSRRSGDLHHGRAGILSLIGKGSQCHSGSLCYLKLECLVCGGSSSLNRDLNLSHCLGLTVSVASTLKILYVGEEVILSVN